MSEYNKNSFLGYINNPMSRDDMGLLYRENNIKYEKCELFSDFALSLIITIFDTYMGDEVTCIENQLKHFNWAWDKTILNFNEEGLCFENDLLYDYYIEFMVEAFYIIPNKSEYKNIDKKIITLWVDIFDYSKIKTNSDMDVLIEIYKIFEKSLNNR
tara:strand:- start:23409 stop:23879 length:471 start_codon:yes stop_codon:yes gene_type:complete